MTIRTISAIAFALLLSGAIMAQPKGEETLIQGHIMTSVLKPGDIPAIFDPEFISVIEAEEFYYSDEPLIAVVDGDEAKAYSIWHLDHHEIVNDYINGKAITVTW